MILLFLYIFEAIISSGLKAIKLMKIVFIEVNEFIDNSISIPVLAEVDLIN